MTASPAPVGPGSASGAARPRRHDPERRDRIIDACLDTIAEHGVAGTSHRRVAADHAAERVERRTAEATTLEQALAGFEANIDEDVFDTERNLVITLELYTLAARRPEFREITSRWMSRTRACLAPHVDPETASLLDAMNEGLTIHRALHLEEPLPHLAREGVARLSRRR